MSDTRFRVCAQCEIRHYENCPECWGFGMVRSAANGRLYPASAEEAMVGAPRDSSDESTPCPTCRSTVKGVPA